MVIVDTEHGIFLAGLVLIAFFTAVIPVLKRKRTFKQLPCIILLAAVMVFWFVKSIGTQVVIGLEPMICINNFIPFGTVFMPQSFIEQFSTRQEYISIYLSPQLIRLAIDLTFGILWGILAPIVFKIESFKKYMFFTAIIVLPLEILINIFFLFGISYVGVYDMGSYILLAVGATLGWLIESGISKIFKNRGIGNDNGNKSYEKL